MDGIKQLLDRLGERLGRFSFNQKVLLGAVVVAALISAAVFTVWLQRDEKAVLFTNLAPEDAALALEELSKQDVPADLANGGTTILVPEPEVHRLRVELASRGIPSSGTVGFEIFDGQQYGLTEFLQNVNFRRALEGELTKSIESLAGIQSARVHLNLPKPGLFRKESSQPTASVVVRVGRGARLDQDRIAGVQTLVAGSVEGMTPENVAVIDQHGEVLSQNREGGDVGHSEDQLAVKKEVETYLGEKAESMLAEVLGSGRSIVRVDATLNFEKIDREREIYDPEATVVRSEERGETSDPQTGGSEETSVTNYEVNRTVERIVGQVGGIESLSVAVFVDGRYEAAGEGGEPAYVPLSDQELEQIQRVVTTAVGLNATRGDQIEVVNMQFEGRRATGTVEPPAAAPQLLQLALRHGGRVLLLLLLVGVLLNLRRNLARMVAGRPGDGAGRGRARAAEPRSPAADLKSGASDRMTDDIRAFADENPQKVAEVLQGWLEARD